MGFLSPFGYSPQLQSWSRATLSGAELHSKIQFQNSTMQKYSSKNATIMKKNASTIDVICQYYLYFAHQTSRIIHSEFLDTLAAVPTSHLRCRHKSIKFVTSTAVNHFTVRQSKSVPFVRLDLVCRSAAQSTNQSVSQSSVVS